MVSIWGGRLGEGNGHKVLENPHDGDFEHSGGVTDVREKPVCLDRQPQKQQGRDMSIP